MRHALDVIVKDGLRLCDARHLRSWSASAQELAAVLRYLDRRVSDQPTPALVGIIGGASSGKSTVFNNLLGGRHASQVTMTSHTTKGVILAVHTTLEDTVAAWLDHERILLPRLQQHQAEPDDRSQGSPNALTVIHVLEPTLENLLLFDTPDFTTQTARREGDLARRLLPWFDCVLVLVDEERWFDEQTFGQLRDELNRLGTARMILFNCNEGRPATASPGAAGLTEDDQRKLQAQARRMDAAHIIIEYRHGRGFRKFPGEVLRPCVEWLTQTIGTNAHESPAAGMDRRGRIARLVSDHAGHVLNENAQRRARLEELKTLLAQAIDDELPATKTIVWKVILSPQQQKLLSPYWRSLGRSVDWLRGVSGAVTGRLPLVGPRRTTDRPEDNLDPDHAADPSDRGQAFFVSEAARLVEHLCNRATTSRFWREAGMPHESIAETVCGRRDDAAIRSDARSCVQACADGLARFEQRVAGEAANLKVNVAGVGIGAMVGVLVGGVLALPTGGLSVPAGAVLGVLIAAPASGVSARACVRLYNAVKGTSESCELFAAVDQYRNALKHHAETTVARILALARSRTLDSEPELLQALHTLRDADTGDQDR